MKWMLYYADPAGEEFVRLNVPECYIDRVPYISSSNALVCLAANQEYECIHILNPSTKRFKIIPTPNIKACSGISLNFGFDYITNDYKLLRSVFDVSNDVFRAQLYSANADSWKEIQASEILQSSRIFPSSVSYMERFHKLISHNDVLKLYPICPYLGRMSLVLDFEGSFAQIMGYGSVYSLWMLEDVCGKLSWNEKFNLEYDSMIFEVISYLGDGQFVAQDHDLQYISYD